MHLCPTGGLGQIHSVGTKQEIVTFITGMDDEKLKKKNKRAVL